jgi:malonyl-CoA O-methyltransferase
MATLWPKRKRNSVLSVMDGYNRWAGTYSQESNPIKNLSNQILESWLPLTTGIEVLDAGCGTGHFSEILTNRNLAKVTGIDFSPLMIDVAKKRVPAAEFICQDLSSVQLERNRYDLVISALVLAHIRELDPTLTKLIRGLKKGGLLLISDFHPYLTLQKSKRTFRDQSGRTFEISHHLHMLSEVIQIINREGLSLENLEEPMWQDAPAIYAIKATKG